jgi:hypothetical protein
MSELDKLHTNNLREFVKLHKEICSIIKVCVKSNVKELELDTFKVSFFGPQGNLNEADIPHPIIGKESEKLMTQINESTLASLEQSSKQDQLESMAITDPVQYEELLLSGDLEDPDAESKARGSE